MRSVRHVIQRPRKITVARARYTTETKSTFTPVVARKIPYTVQLEANKPYFWCACGLSKKQPFCDGSHKGTGTNPVKFTVEKDTKKMLCACKRTSNAPFCDFTHLKVIGFGLFGKEVEVPKRETPAPADVPKSS